MLLLDRIEYMRCGLLRSVIPLSLEFVTQVSWAKNG